MDKNSRQQRTWETNDWLKDALIYIRQGDPIFYASNDTIYQSLEQYYNDCKYDLDSCLSSPYKYPWYDELQEAVNELSLIFLYGNLPQFLVDEGFTLE